MKRISPLEPQDRGGLSTVAAKRFPRSFGRANRAAASKAPRFFRHWRRFGAFPLDPRTAEGSQPFGNSMGVQELLTTWCASCSAPPLLRFWYENSHEFCPKPHGRAAAAARSRPDRKPQKNRQAVLCTARAASVWQGRTMNGSRAKPVRVFSPLLRGQKRCSRSGDAS